MSQHSCTQRTAMGKRYLYDMKTYYLFLMNCNDIGAVTSFNVTHPSYRDNCMMPLVESHNQYACDSNGNKLLAILVSSYSLISATWALRSVLVVCILVCHLSVDFDLRSLLPKAFFFSLLPFLRWILIS